MRFNITEDQLWSAYYKARKHKRFTVSQLEFELNLYVNIHQLLSELQSGTYRIGTSICFIVKKPKPREVFAANFRDRIVHHLIMEELMPEFEKIFINNSFSCRKGKGVLYGVKKCRESILRNPYGYVAKYDIKGFFLNINKDILWKKLKTFISNLSIDKDIQSWVMYYTKLIVFNHPEDDCIRRSPISDWDLIPDSKSLFKIPKNKGIAIGNLPSQIFASFYLLELDKFMYSIFNKDYGRYVDDFYVVHSSLDTIKYAVIQIKSILHRLELELHKNKVYIQKVGRGIKFIGYFIKSSRIYIGNGTRSNIVRKLHKFNQFIPNESSLLKFRSSLNSYLGILKHCHAYNIKMKLLNSIDEIWLSYFSIRPGLNSIKLK